MCTYTYSSYFQLLLADFKANMLILLICLLSRPYNVGGICCSEKQMKSNVGPFGLMCEAPHTYLTDTLTTAGIGSKEERRVHRTLEGTFDWNDLQETSNIFYSVLRRGKESCYVKEKKKRCLSRKYAQCGYVPQFDSGISKNRRVLLQRWVQVSRINKTICFQMLFFFL